MTGFARHEGRSGDLEWVWEAKSVNGRGLDVRLRLPPGFEALEPYVRKRAAARFARGNLQIALVTAQAAARSEIRVNRAALAQVLEALKGLADTPGTRPASLDGILGLRGVLETAEPATDPAAAAERDSELTAGLDAALAALDDARRGEGRVTAAAIETHLGAMAALIDRAEALAAARPETMRERLRAQVDALLADRPDLPEDRLAQEVALLMVRSDVAEEIQRLKAHIGAAREALASDEAIGRRFDFLCQEFNREANTLCSKSGDAALTAVGLDLKVEIDRLREQVQNVE